MDYFLGVIYLIDQFHLIVGITDIVGQKPTLRNSVLRFDIFFSSNL